MQALEQAGRKGSDAYAELAALEKHPSNVNAQKAVIERRRKELESSREIETLYDFTKPIIEDSKEIISKIEEANKLRKDAQAKSEQAAKETNEEKRIALYSDAHSLNEKAQILDKEVKTSRDSVINNTPIKQAITSAKILGQRLLNKIKLAAKSNEWVSSMPISKEEFTKLENATKRLSVKSMGEVTSNSEVIPDILLIEEINAKYDAELAALEKEKLIVIPTTVPTSKIKDQIAALEDKIANSSSEEEANSYFIEIEALEKQLLEGRKLESDIDRLRGETPINKISQQSAQTFIDFPEAEANIRKLISPASVVNFDDINTLITNIENKGETWGFFAGKSIYLNKAAQKGTEFHEVFHYVFRRLLSDEQIRRLYMLARVKYGTPTIKQLSELKNQSNANKSLRKDQLEELWLEEKMADTFMNYKLGKNKLENMGLIGKILSKIQDFLTWLVGHKTELQALFENINKESFRSDITHYNQFTKKWANPVFKQIPNGEKDTETGKRYTYTGLEEGRQIIRTIAAEVS